MPLMLETEAVSTTMKVLITTAAPLPENRISSHYLLSMSNLSIGNKLISMLHHWPLNMWHTTPLMTSVRPRYKFGIFFAVSSLPLHRYSIFASHML